MVTKEAIVCTKQQAVILKEKGVNQKSLFAWTIQSDKFGTFNILDDNIGEGCAAFTTPELIEFLPKMNKFQKVLFYLQTNLEAQKVADYLIHQI